MGLLNIIKNIVQECVQLKNKHVDEKDLPVDWVCIFCHTQDELKRFTDEAEKIGVEIEKTDSGIIYKFINPPQTVAGKPKVFKIRVPDITKPQIGDCDFTTNYSNFKNKYINDDHFKFIQREKFEMLELMDDKFNVRAYFSSIPPSKLRGVN